MKCKQLLKGLPVLFKGSKDVLINGLSRDSRKIVPGNLFIAQKTPSFDGTKMVAHAVQNGAAAVLTDIYDPFIKVPQLIYPQVAEIVPVLAARFYNNPSLFLPVIAVTGESSVAASYLLRHLLEKKGGGIALLGSIEKWRRGGYVPAGFLAEDVISNHKYLREIVDCSMSSAIMELPSDAFFDGRVEEISFQTAIFTKASEWRLPGLPPEAKIRQSSLLAKSRAIINNDDPYADLLKREITKPVFTYSIGKTADLEIRDIRYFFTKTCFTAHYQGKKQAIELPLIGIQNVYGAAAAISYLVQQGRSLLQISQDIALFSGVPGNLEKVEKHIFIDAASTPEQVQHVLKTIRLVSKRPVIVVFGCCEKRSSSYRRLLAKTVETYADFAIITSDNPRSEDPKKIVREIAQGFSKGGYLVKIDRKEAIFTAVEKASQGFILLILGKGAEKTQAFAHQTVPFDDAAVAKQALLKAASTV